MAIVEMVMPKMGESIMEGTILKWNKKAGDSIDQDESVLEIATDKVDSEVPAPKATKQQQKFRPNKPGGRARLFFSFFLFFFSFLYFIYFIYFINFLLLIRFINSIQFNVLTYVP